MAKRWRRWWWPVVLLGLAGAVPVLVWSGWSAIVDSRDGTSVDIEGDPLAPGYQALVNPTPTLLLIHGSENGLQGVTLMALAGESANAGGSVLFIAPETSTADGLLSSIWIVSGRDGVEDAVSSLLGIRPDDVQVVDDAAWAALVAPVAPVTFDNPDALVDFEGQERFAAGTLDLVAADVGPYLGWDNPGELSAPSLFRHGLFWGAWLDQVGASSAPDVVPGEVDWGMGRFARALAKGAVRIEALPGLVDVAGIITPESDAVGVLIKEMVPFPVLAGADDRPMVRLLNGVGDPTLTASVAQALSGAGANVFLVGNASEFGADTTVISYHDAGYAAAAEAYRSVLGVGLVGAEEGYQGTANITVIFGADIALQPADGR